MCDSSVPLSLPLCVCVYIHLTVCCLLDSDSEGDTVDSDVEGAILAELYFRDVKLKNSGIICTHVHVCMYLSFSSL